MNRTVKSIALLIALIASQTIQADNGVHVEVSAVLREHDYDLDIIDGPYHYTIDEYYRGGWKLEVGWSFASNWALLVDYQKYESENADGIILSPGSRVQEPITYVFQRAALGLRYTWSVRQGWGLDASVRWQRTEQGVGDFFIQSDSVTFGLDAVEKDAGLAVDVALRKMVGSWSFELLAGYDPDAGFELSATSVDVSSSAYGGVGVAYQFNDHLQLGLEVRSGHVNDLGLTVGVTF